MFGELLHVLIGYDEEPSAIQVIVFAVSLSMMAMYYYRLQSSAGRAEAAPA